MIKEVLKTTPDIGYSVSYTTRPVRPGEEDGRDYFFVSIAEFSELILKDEFLEYAEVHGNFYGTSKTRVNEEIGNGRDVILEIDVQGALQVKKKFEDAVSIFILPPSMAVLRQRLLSRASDAPDEIQRRLQKVKEEVWSYREYAYIVRNDDLTRSLHDLESIFLGERL